MKKEKCKYAIKVKNKFDCSKCNDPYDMGQCLFEDGIINVNFPVLCSEGVKLKENGGD